MTDSKIYFRATNALLIFWLPAEWTERLLWAAASAALMFIAAKSGIAAQHF